jgi:hypothetical protein
MTVLRMLDNRPRESDLWVFAGLLLATLQLGPFAVDTRFSWSQEKYDRWLTLGAFLAANHAGQTVAVDAAGKIPFASGLHTIDLLGLNDRHIAQTESDRFRVGHSKQDPDYVLTRKPHLIASWIRPNLDMMYGMTRERYASQGYTVAYLVNAARHSNPNGDILDVSGRPPQELSSLVATGYRYGVLARGPDDPR